MDWISTKYELPDAGERVLIYCESQGIQLCYRAYNRNDYCWRFARTSELADLNITHWMSLPGSPK